MPTDARVPEVDAVTIAPLTIPPNEGVVSLLRRLLERAEAGDIQAIVVATEMRERCISTGYAGALDVYWMLGAIESLKLHIVKDHDA